MTTISSIWIVGAIFASKTKYCTCNLFLALESHIGKTPSLFLPYKAWANENTWFLPQRPSVPFIVGAIFASKTKCCTCNLFLALESHIGKTHSLFLPYKAWANEKEYH